MLDPPTIQHVISTIVCVPGREWVTECAHVCVCFSQLLTPKQSEDFNYWTALTLTPDGARFPVYISRLHGHSLQTSLPVCWIISHSRKFSDVRCMSGSESHRPTYSICLNWLSCLDCFGISWCDGSISRCSAVWMITMITMVDFFRREPP